MADRRDDPDTDDARSEERLHDASLVERVRSGDEQAFGEIYDKWFDRVHDLALRIVRDPETAAEVAQDTFLSAWQKLDSLEQPSSLGGWLLRIARNRALNRSDREKRSTAVGDDTMVALEAGGGQVSAPAGFRIEERVARADDPAIAAEDSEAAALVWSAASALGERDQTVLTLQLRYGMTPVEIGEAMGVNRNAANQMVHRVKGRLDAAVQARVLWDGERPRCERLVVALAVASVDSFGPDAVKVAEKHAKACDECGERRRLRLQPTALFAALPVLIAPQLLKQKVAAALVAEGVPLDPSAYGVAVGREGFGDQGSPGGRSPSGEEQAPPGDGHPPGDGSGLAAAYEVSAADGSPWRRRGVIAAGIAALVVVVLGGVVLLASDGGEPDAVVAASLDEGDETPEESESAPANDDTTTSAGVDVTVPGSLAPAPAPAGDQADPAVPPIVQPQPVPQPLPPSPPAPPPAPPVDPLDFFTLSPSTKSGSVYFLADAPLLSWSVKSGYTVRVSGPGLPARSSLSGSVAICPTRNPPWGQCLPGTGSFDYVISIRFGTTVVATETRTLTVTP